MERHTFEHDGLTFSYLDAGGTGAPLIALHATWMEAGTFAELAEALRPSWRVFALDQRGHGYSGHSDDFTWKALIGDLAAFVDHLSLTAPFPLLGNSLGGAVAFRYAALHPKRVQSMVIEEMGAVINPDFSFMKAWAGTFPSREALLERIGPRLAWSVEPSIRKAGDRWTLAFSAEKLADAAAELRGDFWNDWKATACPALVIRGSESRVIDGRLLEQMAEERPNTVLRTFHAGHVVHHDVPDDFATAVAHFLRGSNS